MTDTPIYQLRQDLRYWEQKQEDNDKQARYINGMIDDLKHQIKQQQSWDSKAHG